MDGRVCLVSRTYSEIASIYLYNWFGASAEWEILHWRGLSDLYIDTLIKTVPNDEPSSSEPATTT